MRKKVALFDVCHTLVKITTITDFVDYFLSSKPKHFLRKKILYLFFKFLKKIRLIRSKRYKKHLVSLFSGYSEKEVLKVAKDYVSFRLKNFLKEEIFQRLKELKKNGYQVILLSAGLDIYLKEFSDFLDVDLVCTVLEKNKEGYFTGKILGLDCLGKNKVLKLKEILSFKEVDWQESVAFGDNFSDLPFLSLVKKPILVDPDKKLEKWAKEKGWEIIKTKK